MDPFTIAAIFTAITGTASMVQQQKAVKNQRKAAQVQREAENLRAAKERRDAIRQGMLARAASESASWNQGAGTSSSALGGQGSITSQANSNVHYISSQQTAGQVAGSFLDSAAKAQGSASMWSSLSNLALASIQSGALGTASWLKPTEPQAQFPTGGPAAPGLQQVNTGTLFPYLASKGWTNR